MSVEFEEEQITYMARPVAPKKTSLLVRVAYATGLATDEAGAQRALLISAIVLFAIAAGVYFFSQPSKARYEPNPSDSIYQQEVRNGTIHI